MVGIERIDDSIVINGYVCDPRKLSSEIDNSVGLGVFRIFYAGRKILSRPLSYFTGFNSLVEVKTNFDNMLTLAMSERNDTRVTPLISKILPSLIPANQTVDLEIIGDNFSYDSVLEFDNAVTVNSYTVVSPTLITANIDTPNAGVYSVNVKSANSNSNVWGVVAINVVGIPTGASLLLQSSASTNPNKHVGVPFARSTRNSASPSLAFDNNNNTSIERDNADTNAGWYVGIMMSQPTLLQFVSIQTRRGSTGILIQGSNDTTDGTDGTWTDITTFTGLYPIELPVVGIHIYTAFRAVFPTPSSIPSSLRCGAREVYFTGKQ